MSKKQQTNNVPDKEQDNLPIIAGPRLPYHPAIEERFGIDRSGWKALVEAIFPNAQSTESVVLALSYCKARKLDPFKRCIHIVPIWDKQRRCYIDTIWPGIGEVRTTAHRTKDYAGRDKTEFGPMQTQTWEGVDEKKGAYKKTVTFPEWAQVTLYRMLKGHRVAYAGPQVFWLETYGEDRNGTPNSMWQKRPRGQIDKCFDSETQVLTDQGFQPFGFVTGRIMQVVEGRLTPTDVVPFSRKYDGEMIVCDGNALNFCVTPNHDMITTIGKISARDVFERSTSSGGHVIPLSITGSTEDAEFSDQQIILAAAIVCDGYRHANEIQIGVSRQRKVSEIESLGMHHGKQIRRCAGDSVEASGRVIVTRFDKTIFRFSFGATGGLTTESGDLSRDAVLTMSRRQARLLVDSMIGFDGCTSKTARRFYSSSPQTLGVFELAACIAGYSVSSRKERTSDIGGPNWCITVSSKEQIKMLRTSQSQGRLKGGLLIRDNTDGYVWCCRVPSGVLVVRRRGLSMLCGNCAEAAALRAAFPEEVGNDYIDAEAHLSRNVESREVETDTKSGVNALKERLQERQQAQNGGNGDSKPETEPTEPETAEDDNEGQGDPEPVDPELRDEETNKKVAEQKERLQTAGAKSNLF